MCKKGYRWNRKAHYVKFAFAQLHSKSVASLKNRLLADNILEVWCKVAEENNSKLLRGLFFNFCCGLFGRWSE